MLSQKSKEILCILFTNLGSPIIVLNVRKPKYTEGQASISSKTYCQSLMHPPVQFKKNNTTLVIFMKKFSDDASAFF